jgi:hypothetical protein
MILRKITRFAIKSSDLDSVHTAPCSPDSPDVPPSLPHPQPIMNIEDEFGSLRAEMEVQQRHTTAIQESLDTLLARLGVVDNERQQGAFPPLHPTASSSNAGAVPTFDGEENSPPPVAHNRLKPGVPPSFDGDREKGRAFMNSCVLYQLLCAAEFQDDQAKIHWVLSYMKSDCTATFADHTICYKTKYNSPRYGSWDAFQRVFIETFCLETNPPMPLCTLSPIAISRASEWWTPMSTSLRTSSTSQGTRMTSQLS